MRIAALAAAACLAVAGCGGGSKQRTHATASERPVAPTVVFLKRWAGSDPAEDDVLVRRDHTADLHLIHGGAGGRFRTVRLSGREWDVLMATAPPHALAHPGPVHTRPVLGGYRYVVTVPGVNTVTGDNGVLPMRVERVVAALNRIVDDHAF